MGRFAIEARIYGAEGTVFLIAKNGVLLAIGIGFKLFHKIVDVSIGSEQIAPTVVIEIDNAQSPAGEGTGGCGYFG